ncbi:MAG: phosphoribosylamine--glycine ligase [Bryobacterales bacterium]|nr:phosphoribosylamine--glycine ligase [Bryobacterales bacterium]
MKILVLGGGGREHAIAWRLSQEPGNQIFACPGNPGIARHATCLPAGASRPEDFLAAAKSIGADLTIAGPEAPLVAGVADLFHQHGLLFFGPTAAAARLEGSKLFAKQVMSAAAIPTARYEEAYSVEQARDALSRFEYPLVLKADGLAAGKGVIIARNPQEAGEALNSLTATLGTRLVIEEFLEGEEASFIVIADGKNALALDASQDHKTIFDGDQGPNTGGMGAYSDGRILTADQTAIVMDTVIQPTLDYMASAGTPFSGFLYAGIMMTTAGPQVLEYNVRLGDPETQSLLHRLRGGFSDALVAAARGDLAGHSLDWSADPSVCVVLAAQGYPGTVRTADPIHGISDAESLGATVFHAGTRLEGSTLVTAGGRVLGVTASGNDLATAITTTYRAVERIRFDGMQYRKDIGKKGLKRW